MQKKPARSLLKKAEDSETSLKVTRETLESKRERKNRRKISGQRLSDEFLLQCPIDERRFNVEASKENVTERRRRRRVGPEQVEELAVEASNPILTPENFRHKQQDDRN